MLLMNAAPEKVVGQHDGAYYVFSPGERKEILNPYAAKHIVKRWEKYGIVDITFNESIAKQFVDHELFVHEKRKEGLQNVLQTLLEQNQGYMSFDEECGQKQSVERLKFSQAQKVVQAKIKAVEELIKRAEDYNTQELLDKKSEKLLEQAAALKAQAEKLRGNDPGKSKGRGSN